MAVFFYIIACYDVSLFDIEAVIVFFFAVVEADVDDVVVDGVDDDGSFGFFFLGVVDVVVDVEVGDEVVDVVVDVEVWDEVMDDGSFGFFFFDVFEVDVFV